MKVSLHINLLQFFELRDTKFVIFFFLRDDLPDGREYQTLLDPLRTGRNPEVQILGLSEVRRFQVSLFEGQNFSFFPVCHQGRRIGGEGRSLSLCMSNIWRGKVKKVCPPTHTRRKVFLDRSRRRRVQRTRRKEKKEKKKRTQREGRQCEVGTRTRERNEKEIRENEGRHRRHCVRKKREKEKREREKSNKKRIREPGNGRHTNAGNQGRTHHEVRVKAANSKAVDRDNGGGGEGGGLWW